MLQITRATALPAFPLDVESLEQRMLLSVSPLYPYALVDHSGITQGPDGRTWLIDATADRIRRIASNGQVEQFTFPGADGKALDLGNDIATGADGKLWFGLKDVAGWHVAHVSTDGLLEIVSPAGTRAVTHFEAGADGKVWFARADGTIARIDPAGQIADVAAPNVRQVYDLELAADGSMWFTGGGTWETDTNAFTYGELVGSITPDGLVSEYRTDSTFGRLTDIVASDDGFLYFGASGAIGRIGAAGGTIEKFSVGAIDAWDLTAGPDGNVWFLDLGKPLNPLARLTFIDEDGKSTDEDVYRVYHAALIDWGDGTETWGVVGERADGSFDVLGSHTYAEAGEYTVKLVVRRNTRYMPQLPRWRRGRDGNWMSDIAGYASDGSGRGDKKDEYARTLFTVRVKKPKKITPPKCRPGQKPKRDNCVVVKKKKADKKKFSPATERAVVATADVLSLFSSRRIVEADAPSLF